MERKWVEYGIGPLASKRDQIYVSANPRGLITVNEKCYNEMGRPRAVVIVVDEENSAIGLRPDSPEKHNSYLMSANGKSRSYRIMCKRFFREKRIKIEETSRFTTARVEAGVLILELKHRVPAGRGERSNRG